MQYCSSAASAFRLASSVVSHHHHPSHTRTFAAAAAAGGNAVALKRLQKLRDELGNGPSLGSFVSGSGGSGSGVASFPSMVAGCAPVSSEPVPDFVHKQAKPSWLRVGTLTGAKKETFDRLQTTVKASNLATVCEEAKCPNIGECWGGKSGAATATIMLMGDTCTRGCYFCNVKTSRNPPPLDVAEPKRVADAVAGWNVDYIVLTSVDRDDLADQGSEHLAKTVRLLKEAKPNLLVEVLTPDFRGDGPIIDHVARSGIDVFAHNVETVERLQSRVRDHRAGYAQSIGVLQRAKQAKEGILTKTSIMLGLGEEEADIRRTIHDIRNAGIDVITFGQYLRPTARHLPVHRYVTPEEFDAWKAEADAAGFLYVASGPLVRSSYKAGEYFLEHTLKKKKMAAAAAAAGTA